ncbi:MAG: hypothetical protein LHV68_11820 [Elusimicrobia bacterium]|nr:hypothetical protein [Candidatus Liberimonas magnetica]
MKEKYRVIPLVYIIILLFVLSAFYLAYLWYNNTQNVWKKIGLEIAGQNNVRVIEISERKLKDFGVLDFFGSFDGRYIKISQRQNMNKAESGNYIVDEGIRIRSLFLKKVLPYPGSISFSTESDARLLPVEGIFAVENKPVKYYLLYAEEGFRPCVYDVNKIKYRLLSFFLNNEKKRCVYKIEYYFPNSGDKIDDEISILSKIRYK